MFTRRYTNCTNIAAPYWDLTCKIVQNIFDEYLRIDKEANLNFAVARTSMRASKRIL